MEAIAQVLQQRDHNNSLPTIPYPAVQDGLMIDFDQSFQEWRYRHLKLARMIGNAFGTGGSAGVPYLIKSVFKSFSLNLLAIRI
jgi:tryptophan 2,3-dioxygenase